MASANFTNLARMLAKAELDFDTVTCKVLLVSSVPSAANLDSWTVRSDVNNEITGTNYTAGGISQGFTLEAIDTTNNRQTITYQDITAGWTSATFSCVGAIIYTNTGSAATDKLLHFVDFGGTQSCTAANFDITYTTPFYIND